MVRTKTILGIMLVLFIAPAFAATLNINTSSLAPTYVNTNSSATMLNITLNVTGTNPNVSITIDAINISLSNLSTANFTYVEIKNSTHAVLGSNTTFNATDNRTTIRFSSALIVNNSANVSLSVFVNTSNNAEPLTTFSVNVSAASFEANDTTFIEGSVDGASGFAQIQDLHARAAVTPLIVDSSVINQSFVYVITPTGSDTINKTTINIPIGYSLVSVDTITYENSNTTPVTVDGNTTGNPQINISHTASTSNPIIVYFTMNTNSSDKLNLGFNSTITGSNLSDINTSVTDANTTVSTQQIVNITSVHAIKNAAYLNGSDYWEFIFNINFTANLSGRLQFNMSGWNGSATNSYINLNSTGTHYASIRSNSAINSSGIVNITNQHNISSGISFNTSSITNSSIYLRMILPSTVTTVSPSWWAVYTIIFRADT